MTQPPISAKVLANWQYTQEEWRRFGSYEGRHWLKLIKQSERFIVVFGVLSIIALALVPIFVAIFALHLTTMLIYSNEN